MKQQKSAHAAKSKKRAPERAAKMAAPQKAASRNKAARKPRDEHRAPYDKAAGRASKGTGVDKKSGKYTEKNTGISNIGTPNTATMRDSRPVREVHEPRVQADNLQKEVATFRPRFVGERPQETVPLILETTPSADYALIDSGNGRKLERYGPYFIIRPEGQALWQPALMQADWDKADAIFTGNTEEEGMGRWLFPQTPLGETWPLQWNGLPFLGRFTSFRHVGVFPEQDAHWSYMEQQIKEARRPVRVLNLFGYTGVASLIAARAGAEVTHVDASKKAIGWARENQEMAGLLDKPIRWICEDAMKFVEREARRGKSYDIILLDPPAYGRGPHGEVWQLFDHLPDMVNACRAIVSDKPLAVVLTAYSIRASFYAIHELMRDSFTGLGGRIQSGELILREEQAGRALSTSLFSRWVA